MKQKQLLLWIIALVALFLSLLAVFGPRLHGVESDAAYPSVLQRTQY